MRSARASTRRWLRTRLEERCVRRRRTEVRAAELGDDAAARRALDEAELEQVRLVDVLDRVRSPRRARPRASRGRPARRRSARRSRAAARGRSRSRPALVDLEQLERLARDVDRDGALVAHLGDVADAAEDAVRDARRAARAARDLVGGLVGDARRRGSARSGARSSPARPARSSRGGTSSRSGRAAASSAGRCASSRRRA